MNFLKKQFFLVFIFILVCFLTIPSFCFSAWQAPVGNPYSDNDTFPYIINSEGINDYYILQKPFGIDNHFSVANSDFFVDELNNRVGIATNNPQTTLDVWGTVKFFNTNTLPTCNASLLGAIIFNTTQSRLNDCVNNAWRRIGYDGDLDHWLDYVDCDDSNPSLAVEICGDTISNDCDADINEGCICTASDWSTITCPDMTGCNNNLTYTPTKLTSCIGSAPTVACNCTCRLEHFVLPVPPVCPVCRASATTLYSSLVTGVTCVDSDSISDIYCSDNCTGYCSGNTCCNKTPYYICESKNRVHYDACGVKDSSVYCTYGCDTNTSDCKEDPCAIIIGEAECIACGGNWDEWDLPGNKGALCVIAR